MKITDNTQTDMEKIDLSQEFLQKIANKELKDLQKENLFFFPAYISDESSLSGDQKILEVNSDTFKTTNIMGIVGYQKEQLFIGSRFDNDSDYFFYYLLKQVLNFNFMDLEVGLKKQPSYLDWLVYLFPKYLNEALKKGLYKEYRTFKYNDFNVRGTIDINRQIKENIPFTGKVAYYSREYSYENQVINLIRYTVEFIKKRKQFRKILTLDTVTRENIQAIEEKSQDYQQQGLHKVYSYNARKPIRHTYFFEYRTLQKLCLSILSQETGLHEKYTRDKAYGFLFDGAWLFEEYINLIIKDNFFHPTNKQRQGQQYLFDNSKNKKVGKIYPDFISRQDNNRIIADAKYKLFNNIYGRDYLQLVAYMYRFYSKRGLYLYPYKVGEIKSNYETFHLLQGVNESSNKRPAESDISIIKLGLSIPAPTSSFEQFEVEMKKSEKQFKLLIEEKFSAKENE
ncbi:5-methylcytosine restriction system specificity protein McrC [Desemzia incerta]|uniref:5-methylcytosine restriction system specificity protein McrC n=1 Tax=Desemzia incerta TaxID=82801 RepID=UPI001660ED32|nr:3-isopropylmalate dehydrogenase [Desemzia incerta]